MLIGIHSTQRRRRNRGSITAVVKETIYIVPRQGASAFVHSFTGLLLHVKPPRFRSSFLHSNRTTIIAKKKTGENEIGESHKGGGNGYGPKQ